MEKTLLDVRPGGWCTDAEFLPLPNRDAHENSGNSLRKRVNLVLTNMHNTKCLVLCTCAIDKTQTFKMKHKIIPQVWKKRKYWFLAWLLNCLHVKVSFSCPFLSFLIEKERVCILFFGCTCVYFCECGFAGLCGYMEIGVDFVTCSLDGYLLWFWDMICHWPRTHQLG